VTASGRAIASLLLLILFAALFADAVAVLRQAGLFGQRPPLTTFATGLRLVFVVGAVTLFLRWRDVLERVTLLIGATAAGSSALYGFGMRSPALSAFRLLSHLALYSLAVVVCARRIATTRHIAARPEPRGLNP
jgi:hypothetical protein